MNDRALKGFEFGRRIDDAQASNTREPVLCINTYVFAHIGRLTKYQNRQLQ